ncbi:hypothetical protein Leryth_016771 [Lithospermum erythrorhizon]|nr:hypothetical protein Leryth_016771 [Lithospermum erythrorhizon]
MLPFCPIKVSIYWAGIWQSKSKLGKQLLVEARHVYMIVFDSSVSLFVQSKTLSSLSYFNYIPSPKF